MADPVTSEEVTGPRHGKAAMRGWRIRPSERSSSPAVHRFPVIVDRPGLNRIVQFRYRSTVLAEVRPK